MDTTTVLSLPFRSPICFSAVIWDTGYFPKTCVYPGLSLSVVARWLCYCHVPQSNDSLPRYETTQVFGRSLLKSIFTVTRRQLLEKFRVEKDKLLPEKRTLILTHFPK